MPDQPKPLEANDKTLEKPLKEILTEADHQPKPQQLATQAKNSDLNAEMLRLRLLPHLQETVFEIIPKHMSKAFPSLIISSSAVAIVLLSFLIFVTTVNPSPASFMSAASVFGLAGMIMVIYGLSEWYGFKQSAVIITDQRVINVDQSTFLNRAVTEIELPAIQKVEGEYPTMTGQVMKYGAIKIFKFGEDEPVVIPHIPVPGVLAQQIMHFHHLIAHAGIAQAHNTLAGSINDDQTPELANLNHEAKRIADTKGLQSGSQPTGPDSSTPPPSPQPLSPNGEDKIPSAIVSFTAPVEQAASLLEELPSSTEPTVHYLPQDEAVAVHTVIPEAEANRSVNQLHQEGVQDIRKNGLAA